MMLKEGICWRWWYGVSEKPPRRGRESISVGVDFWILDLGCFVRWEEVWPMLPATT